MPEELLEPVVCRLRLLGQPTRIRLLERLRSGHEASVQGLADDLETTQQNVSRHLGLLTAAGLLERRREGRVVFYRLPNDDVLGLVEATAIRLLTEFRCPRTRA